MNHSILQLFTEETGSSVEDTGVNAAAAAQPGDANAEFDALITGKYKEQYDAKVSDTVRKRLRSSHETVEKMNALTPALEKLSKHYGVEATDTAALCRAVEEDVRFTQQEDSKVHAARSYAMSRAVQWKQQAEQARELYPNLDMNLECQNPQFRSLLLQGLDVGSAYLLLHREDVLNAAAENARKTLATSIASTGLRPVEGAASDNPGRTRTDVAAMSRAERESIRRRAARGEKIRF